MSYRRSEKRFIAALVAPFVLAAAGFGLWVCVSAMMENTKLARFSGDVLRVVSLARDMSQDFKTNDEHATRVLFERLAQLPDFKIVNAEDPAQRGFVNPWGALGSLGLMLSQQEVRLRTRVSSTICRRYLLLNAPDADSLGIQSVEAQDEASFGGGRLIFNAAQGQKKIDEPAIKAGCGREDKVLLSVTFRLK